MRDAPGVTPDRLLSIQFSPRKIAIVLGGIAVALFLISTWVFFVYYYIGHGWTFGYIGKKFDVLSEGNVPTWYSSLLIALAAIAAMANATIDFKLDRRQAMPWLGLFFMLLFLSADEAAAIHEMTNDLVSKDAPDAGGFLRHRWLYVYGALVLLVGAAFLPFYFRLSNRYKLLFALAAFMYVGGALGGESITGYLVGEWGRDNFQYKLAASVEELAEMLGMVVLVYGLLDYGKNKLADVAVKLE